MFRNKGNLPNMFLKGTCHVSLCHRDADLFDQSQQF